MGESAGTVTRRPSCAWEGCDRFGSFPNQEGYLMCSIHHPAGRAHIAARDDRIAELEAERDRLREANDRMYEALEEIGEIANEADQRDDPKVLGDIAQRAHVARLGDPYPLGESAESETGATDARG